jgi:hypothetical protein
MGIEKQPEYVVVTAISSFRQRYVIPMDELAKLNPDEPVNPSWALDCVTCEEVKEFSQRHVGEQIIDAQVVKEAEILQFFDADNDYLAEWDTDFKLEWIRNWKEKPTEEEAAAFEKKRQQFLAKRNAETATDASAQTSQPTEATEDWTERFE